MRNPMPLLLSLLMLAGCSSSRALPDVGPELTTRGARGSVKESLELVSNRARSLFRQLDIQLTGTRQLDAGKSRELTGTLGKTNITITLSPAAESGDVTNMEVEAELNVAQWDPETARQILSFFYFAPSPAF